MSRRKLVLVMASFGVAGGCVYERPEPDTVVIEDRTPTVIEKERPPIKVETTDHQPSSSTTG
ncbi:MAG TPA: hypothetical protein VM328_11055 [Fimbriimonadaceae bacterium]|nr:hypothetical protein [Fimbriimonadaceae bacterium]